MLDEATRHHLAETALKRAMDDRESKYNRYDDLAAVHNIASHLDPDTAAKIRRGVMEISREQHNAGPADFYRDIPLTGLALRTAARLYPRPAERSEIEQIATLHMQTVDLAEASRIIGTIVRVPAEDSSLNLRQCAAHPSPGLRALAAIRWTHDPDALPHDQAFRLAKDPDHRVRADLADALAPANRTPEQQAILAALANDARRSVRGLATAASGTHPTALSEHDVMTRSGLRGHRTTLRRGRAGTGHPSARRTPWHDRHGRIQRKHLVPVSQSAKISAASGRRLSSGSI